MHSQIAAAIMQPQDMLPIQPSTHLAAPLDILDDAQLTDQADDNHRPDDDVESEEGMCNIPCEP